MSNDILFLSLCLMILIIFVVIVFYWFSTSSKGFTVDDTIKGFYDNAGLNQKCMTGTVQTEYTLLSQYYEPQTCGYNLICVKPSDDSVYGYCKSKIGGICNTVYDCAPDGNNDIYCNGGFCSNTKSGLLFANCSGSTAIGNDCETSLGLECSSNQCLKSNGTLCTNNNQCLSGKCASVDDKGATGICISPIPATYLCNTDYCASGFGCDFVNITTGYCQPKFKSVVVETGTKGALCSIPGYSEGNPGFTGNTGLYCNTGLICNFDASNFSNSSYPGLTGFGLCDTPLLNISDTCSSVGGACFPPAVCYNGICEAPLEGGTGQQNINYCGYGSTKICGNGYICVNDYCQPGSTGALCGNSGICQFGTCSNNRIGIFTPNTSGVTGNGSFGNWVYYSLPSAETTPLTNQSQISTYQEMDIDVNDNPRTKTKIIYYPEIMQYDGTTIFPPQITVYFWYAEIIIGDDNNITNLVNWTKIPFIPLDIPGIFPYVKGIKFTSSGNITVVFGDNIVDAICVYDISSLNINTGFTFYPFPSSNIIFNNPNRLIIDWDIDDKYNVVGGISSVVALTSELGSTGLNEFYYGLTNAGDNNGLTGTTYQNNSNTQVASWVKYQYNYTDTPDSKNFIFGGTPVSNTEYSLILPNVNGGTTIPLSENTFSGGAMFPTYTNGVDNFELYYISDRGFRYVNATFNNAVNKTYNNLDIAIEGYIPTFDKSIETNAIDNTYPINTVRSAAYGNIDRRLFALVSTCS